nr:MAG TPA: hypothetical protein [Caudoviricetes sp.]
MDFAVYSVVSGLRHKKRKRALVFKARIAFERFPCRRRSLGH